MYFICQLSFFVFTSLSFPNKMNTQKSRQNCIKITLSPLPPIRFCLTLFATNIEFASPKIFNRLPVNTEEAQSFLLEKKVSTLVKTIPSILLKSFWPSVCIVYKNNGGSTFLMMRFPNKFISFLTFQKIQNILNWWKKFGCVEFFRELFN